MPRKLTQKQHFDLAHKLFEEHPEFTLSQKLNIIYQITMFHVYDTQINRKLRKQQKHAKKLNALFNSPEMRIYLADL